MEELICKIWDSLKLGETVLVEHDSATSPVLGFYHLLKWARERNYPVLVDDVLDTLYLYVTHMKLAGFDTNILNGVRVIKEGGTLNVGRVVARIGINEASVRRSNYERVFGSLLRDRPVVNPVLGAEKLFMLTESAREMLTTLNVILSYTGDERRIAFFFINLDLINKTGTCILCLLEELATTVIRIVREGKCFRFSVVKSVNREIEGMEVRI
ncbi:DUF257 family protein [Thermococcus sp.]